MKVHDWLTKAVNLLAENNIPSARLDALVILEDYIKKDRAWILANPDFDIDQHIESKMDGLISRRAKHEPLAYIRGKSEFYGREFIVTPATLQPRPETETMIDQLKMLDLHRHATIADIGTGSGAIAITAQIELPNMEVLATEINADAYEIAVQNNQKHKTDVIMHIGNLLEPLEEKNINVLLANLPYVPDKHTINQAAMQEPKIAIFGGHDGLDLYRQLFEQIRRRTQKPSYVLTECLPFQHPGLSQIAHDAGYAEVSREDFIQIFKKSRSGQ